MKHLNVWHIFKSYRGHPGADDYYDEDDFIDPLEQQPQQKKQMTLAEEKEALKRKIKDLDYKKKKPLKYKKESKDILNDAKGNQVKTSYIKTVFWLSIFCFSPHQRYPGTRRWSS